MADAVADNIARQAPIRRGEPSRSPSDHSGLCLLEEGNYLLSRHQGEPVEKVVDQFASLEVVNQRLQGKDDYTAVAQRDSPKAASAPIGDMVALLPAS